MATQQRRRGSAGGRGAREVVVRGIGPKDFLNREMIENMIEGLNAAIGDGHKIKIAG